MADGNAIYVDIVADVSPLTQGLNAVYSRAASVFAGIKSGAESAFSQMSVFSNSAKEKVLSLFSEGLTPLGNYLSSSFNGILANVRSGFQDIITNGASPLSNFLSETLLPNFETVRSGLVSGIEQLRSQFAVLIDYITGNFSPDWSRTWESIKTVFENVWTGMVTTFRGSVNSMISMINGLINAAWSGLSAIVNTVGSIIENFGELLGFSGWGFTMPSAPSIPYLATGGIVSSPTLAMIGESGREAVLPLENNTGWMTELANVLAQAVSAGTAFGRSGSGGDAAVNLYIDGKKMAEAVIDNLNEVQARRGISTVINTV